MPKPLRLSFSLKKVVPSDVVAGGQHEVSSTKLVFLQPADK